VLTYILDPTIDIISGPTCRSRGSNQDKSLVFAFAIFSVIYFPFMQVYI